MYMSYCRHEGTYQELRCCLSDAEEHISGEAEFAISKGEAEFFKRMVEEMYDWMCNQELLDENGELDYDKLEEISEAMQIAGTED